MARSPWRLARERCVARPACISHTLTRLILNLVALGYPGSYGILVKDGQITTAGATLRSSGKTHWVHAPHCHALPVLRCPEEAEIQLRPHPAASDLRRLERLSPTFARLWNDQHPVGGAGRKALETFQIVSAQSSRQACLPLIKVGRYTTHPMGLEDGLARTDNATGVERRLLPIYWGRRKKRQSL